MRALILSAVFFALAVATLPADESVRFNRDIRPILSENCFACHGPDKGQRPTALRFDTEEGAFVDLASGGKAIAPGDPQASKLLERVTSDHPVLRMPPAYEGRPKLEEREIELLQAWIEQGAEWESHWAFVPPERPEPPPVEAETWVRNPIDRFIARRLEREGLVPQPEADRTTLIRRATLDLTGLPPTPTEVDRFVGDASPVAYEKLLDRLLRSPRYGERMAFRWLDAARYADTNGYQNDERRSMWRWRDWVIDAFNRNQPFDEFTVEQLAGDLLPHPTLDQVIATGFNRNHRGNGELGIVPEEYHVEYVVDRVETTSTVWLGLTLGCARCHDHKYDPVTQKEFYRFYAYFNSVPDRGRYFKYGNTPPIAKAPTSEQRRQLDALDERIEALKTQLAAAAAEIALAQADWRPAEDDWIFDERLIVREPLDAVRFDGVRSIDLGDQANFGFWDGFTLSAWIKPETPTGGILTRMEPKATARGNKGYGLFLIEGKLHFRIESTDIDDRMRIETFDPIPLDEWTHVAVTYDGSRLARGVRLYVNGRFQQPNVLIDHSNNDTKAENTPLRIGHGPGPEDRFVGLIDEARVYDRALAGEEVAVLAVPESPSAIAALEDRSSAQARKLRWAFLEQGAPPPIRDAWRELRRLRLERASLVDGFPTVMVMAETPQPRPAHVLNRGAYDARGERVERGVPAVLPALPDDAPTNRLGLARWLVEPNHPLTARVTVNRFWQMLFGVGIVSTVEDFGAQGEWPTHPELLDWLAVEFVESGWDVKRLLKTILMSATYRQSAIVTPASLQKDPENRLLSRAPRIRLPAETIRDQALAIAGLLEEKIGGPSVKPYQPAGLWKELSNWGAYEHDEGPGLYRRSLYTFWKRTIAPPAMVAFDSAMRETCVVRETRTNTPLQALNLMNDVAYLEAARLLGRRMLTEAGDSPRERLTYGFRLAVAREPAAPEEEILLRALRRYLDRYQTYPEDADKLLVVGEYPRAEALPPAERAAYATVASMILNLDETITKE